MKNLIFIHVIICMCTFLLVKKADCQFVPVATNLNIETAALVSTGDNKSVPVTTVKYYRNNISMKAVRDFIKNYKDSRNVTWSKANGIGYTAQFINDSIQTRVSYDRRGSWDYTMKRYAENKMPADVRALIKSVYFEYTIAEVTEFRLQPNSEKTIYSILIKYGTNFKILKICNLEMEIVSDYTLR